MSVLQLIAVPGVTIYGPSPEKRGSPLCAFNVEGVHATDVSTFLDFEGEQSMTLPVSAAATACVSFFLLWECETKDKA